jgi:hypothetical protein
MERLTADLVLKYAGNVGSALFGFGGFFAGEQFIYRLGEQGQPLRKMLLLHRQRCVRHKWLAIVGMIPQQQGLPEPVHFFQVRRPVLLYARMEHRCQQSIFADLIVEGIHEQLYVFYAAYLPRCCHGVKVGVVEWLNG